jgi:hypothetical protein
MPGLSSWRAEMADVLFFAGVYMWCFALCTLNMVWIWWSISMRIRPNRRKSLIYVGAVYGATCLGCVATLMLVVASIPLLLG